MSENSTTSEEDFLEGLIIKPTMEDEFNSSMYAKQQQTLNNVKIDEQKQRLAYRKIMYWCFFFLLVGQHALLVVFIVCVICIGALSSLQPLLGVIIPATLGETYIVMRQMVEFIFQPGDYRLSEKTQEKE